MTLPSIVFRHWTSRVATAGRWAWTQRSLTGHGRVFYIATGRASEAAVWVF